MWRLASIAVSGWLEAAGAVPSVASIPLAEQRRAAESVRFIARMERRRGAPLWHALVLYFARRNRVGGITLGDHVYLYGAEGLGDWPLLAHEVTHVMQMQREGQLRFYLRYVWIYVQNRLAGLREKDPYEQLPQEIQARAVEHAARRGQPPPAFLAPEP